MDFVKMHCSGKWVNHNFQRTEKKVQIDIWWSIWSGFCHFHSYELDRKRNNSQFSEFIFDGHFLCEKFHFAFVIRPTEIWELLLLKPAILKINYVPQCQYTKEFHFGLFTFEIDPWEISDELFTQKKEEFHWVWNFWMKSRYMVDATKWIYENAFSDLHPVRAPNSSVRSGRSISWPMYTVA